jgi:hypothetical protein
MESGESWYQRKTTLLWWNLREFDMLGLPWMVAVMLAVVLILEWRKDKNTRRVLEFACLSIGFAVFVAMLSPQSVRTVEVADVRYLFPAVPFLAALTAAVVHFVHRRGRLWAAALFLVIVTTNLLGANPWGWRFRWLLPAYISEVHRDYPTSYSEVIAFFRQNARQDDLVATWPEHTNNPILFYLGDKVRLCCLLDKHTSLPMETVEELERSGAPLLADRHYPDWIVFFGRHKVCQDILTYFSRTHVRNAESVRMDYRPVAALDIYCYDTQRPELHLHSFGPKADFDRRTEAVYIFKVTVVPSAGP